MPRAAEPPQPEIDTSPPLSLTFRPGDGSIGDAVSPSSWDLALTSRLSSRSKLPLAKAGAVIRRLAVKLSPLQGRDGDRLEPDATSETMPSVCLDAAVLPEGSGSLTSLGQPVEFLRDQYRHCKPILIMGEAGTLADETGIPLDEASDWAIVSDAAAFIAAIGKHRNWNRATDPPLV